MGDSGALFLGFVMGAIALLSEYDRSRNLGTVLLTPVLILLIPIFDTCMVTVTRKLSGRPISQGGRDHTSHRLVALGISERRAVLLLYALAVAAGLLALIVRGMRIEALLLLVPVFALSLLAIGLYLAKAHIYEEGEHPAGNTILKVFADFPYKRRVFEIMLDAALVTLAYYGAFVLRFDAQMAESEFLVFRNTLPLVIGVQMLCFLLCGLYRGLWRYMTVDDLVLIAKPAVVGAAVNACMVYTIYDARQLSPAVFVLFAMLLAVVVSASRSSFRLLRRLIVGGAGEHLNAKLALIYGAGDRAEFLLHEIHNNSDYQYRIVGFIDDDLRKVGKTIHGFRIFNIGELPELIRRFGVSEVLVSSPKIPENRLSELRRAGVHLKRMNVRIESDHVVSEKMQSASSF
jgi:UDP-GlcNAc:undecaprenyl-phosphate GlcNAc-1-phosphate transferase